MNQLLANDLKLGIAFPVGVDEAGRGALAGPVVIAAVILSYAHPLDKLNDSKLLTSKQRELLYAEVIADAEAWSIIEMDHFYIDEHNILEATLEGMRQAIAAIGQDERLCLIDGNIPPRKTANKCQTVIKGDGIHGCIAAASILAKVHRDRLMLGFHKQYPSYSFDSNKGYGSKAHLDALSQFGPCPIHRLSYAPVREQSIWQIINDLTKSGSRLDLNQRTALHMEII